MAGESFSKCACRHCGNRIEFPTTGVGLCLACPHCGETTELFLEGSAGAAPLAECVHGAETGELTEEELLAAFGEPIRPKGVSLLYQLVAGTEGFESTTRRIRVLEAAAHRAYKELRRCLQGRGALPESFPLYLLEQETQLPPETKERIHDRLGLVRTRLFDSHPSDADRIRQARRAVEAGVFRLRQPATLLFSNFRAVSKQVTLLHYTDDLGLHGRLGAWNAA